MRGIDIIDTDASRNLLQSIKQVFDQFWNIRVSS